MILNYRKKIFLSKSVLIFNKSLINSKYEIFNFVSFQSEQPLVAEIACAVQDKEEAPGLLEGQQFWGLHQEQLLGKRQFDSNDILASGSGDRTIKLWNKNTGDLLRTLSGHGNWVGSVAFDSKDILASGDGSDTILWNKNTGNLLRTLSGHGSVVLSVAFDSNDILASGSADRSIKLWG